MVMNKSCNKFCAKYGEHLTRIVVGLIFVLAGYGKLFATPGIQGFSGMLSGIGFPAFSVTVLAVLVGVIELVGGVFLIVGLWTRESASALAVIMLVAVIFVHVAQGWAGLRYPLLLLSVCIYYAGHAPSCTLASHIAGKKAPAKKVVKKSAAKKKK